MLIKFGFICTYVNLRSGMIAVSRVNHGGGVVHVLLLECFFSIYAFFLSVSEDFLGSPVSIITCRLNVSRLDRPGMHISLENWYYIACFQVMAAFHELTPPVSTKLIVF